MRLNQNEELDDDAIQDDEQEEIGSSDDPLLNLVR